MSDELLNWAGKLEIWNLFLNFKPEIEALLANGSTQKFIANRYKTTEANLYNWLLKHGLKIKK